MLVYPNFYFNNVREIDIELLRKHNIKGLILDVDNTLIDYDRNFEDGTIEWAKEMKQQGIILYIVSNSNKKEKVKKVAETLEIPFINFAKKPLKSGFLKAMRNMGLRNENIAAVGDQIMTDVIGANRCRMYSILVKPIAEKDILITKIKRPIENIIINSYLKKIKKEKV